MVVVVTHDTMRNYRIQRDRDKDGRREGERNKPGEFFRGSLKGFAITG